MPNEYIKGYYNPQYPKVLELFGSLPVNMRSFREANAFFPGMRGVLSIVKLETEPLHSFATITDPLTRVLRTNVNGMLTGTSHSLSGNFVAREITFTSPYQDPLFLLALEMLQSVSPESIAQLKLQAVQGGRPAFSDLTGIPLFTIRLEDHSVSKGY